MTNDADEHEREYVCEVCERTFESEAELEDHVHEEGQLT
jgi:hypothetical protein